MDTLQPSDITQNNSIDPYAIAAYLIIFVLIYLIYWQIIKASNDKKAFTQNLFYNIIIIVIPIILVFMLIVYSSFQKTFAANLFFGAIIFCMMVFGTVYLLKTTFAKYFLNAYLLYALIGLFILVGLAIVFTMYVNKLRKLGGWSGFLANLLFYIPCMIQDGIRVIIQEYRGSSNTLLTLFIIELLIIIMYFFAIPLVNEKSFPEKIVLQNDPLMLNKQIYMDNKLKDKTKINCGISFWIYINTMPDTKKAYSPISPETVIFNYSNYDQKDINPHIKISYSNSEKGNNDYIMQIGKKQFTISLPFQKWHNFVINFSSYDEPTPTASPSPTPSVTVSPVKQYITDIFIDGVLARSYTSDTAAKEGNKYNTQFLNSDIIYIGNGSPDRKNRLSANSNVDGVYGAICNLVYYTKPLTKLAIVYKYNTMLLSNPPIE